jgi:hypothetical protein
MIMTDSAELTQWRPQPAAVLRNAVQFLLLAVVVSAVGCSPSGSFFKSSATLFRDPGRLIGRPAYERNVVKVVALWEAAHGKGMDGKNCRGFAGQVLFFGPKVETGVQVHGTVRITLYDEYDPEAEEEPEPLHQFEFTPEAWDVHRGEGTLGHSYSVFVPYVNKHRNQVNCALRVDLVQDDGHVVSSRETEILLPGRDTKNAAAARTRGFIQERRIPDVDAMKAQGTLADETGAETPLPTARGQLKSVSIPLPRR